MYKIRQAIIVEGKYDKAKLSSLVDATIVATGGFSLFHNTEKMQLIQKLAQKDGIIVLTDSDAAGFQIRSYIAGAIPAEQVVHAYIPDIAGKERRKEKASAEGKLGVEGVPAAVLIEALCKAGVLEERAPLKAGRQITASDFVAWELSGGTDSSEKRRLLLKKLDLPERMSTKALLRVANQLYTFEEFERMARAL